MNVAWPQKAKGKELFREHEVVENPPDNSRIEEMMIFST